MLRESSKSHTAPLDPQQIASMFAAINAKLDTLKTFEEKLTKVEATHEPSESPTSDQTPPRNNRRNTDNPSNPDAQYMKSIKDRCPQLHNPQLFIGWNSN